MRHVLIACLISLPAVAHDPWTTQDTILEGLFLAQLAVDRAQTMDIKNHPEKFEYNPLLGVNPSDRRINKYFLTIALVHPMLCYVLPKNARNGFQFVSITVEAYAIGNNFSIGLRARF